MMATASAPSPIHPLYRERWGFSVTMLTVIFAVYVTGLVEFAPEERPHLGPTMTAVGTSVGMAIGAGVVGLLVQVTTHPDA
jgi:hypothetical protein